MTWFLRAAVLTTLATTAGVAARSPSIEVPVGRPAVVDGVPEAGEWDDAVAVPLSGGGEVQLKHDGHDLFVSIRGQGLGSASLAFGHGHTVRILHASTRQLTAIYRRDGQVWRLDSSFRDGPQNEIRRTAPAQHQLERSYAVSRWQSDVLPPRRLDSDSPRSSREFRIDLDLLGSEPCTMSAVLHQHGASPEFAGAPLDLADGSLSELLVRGECPPELRFEPDTWFEITINREDVS